ncbi:CPXCG motif-containing cysteine-rich protein [Neptunomonas antarctica]|uniref:Cysteine-rich CPXCG n=1 Tax=Neptunomonas antarctica TaxID=619304 RepID=A0A1N7K2Z7_9GAMM|nr:CPXCG motif-containing cysteine-rich protein [Neptunomonas antarctica]SIS55814.1 Cysteine-rich CPXCG [Neptunomonas antarctica]
MNELLETSVYCPYCAEKISVTVEVLDESQEFIEDCQVCCQPITVAVAISTEGSYSISVRSENETI